METIQQHAQALAEAIDNAILGYFTGAGLGAPDQAGLELMPVPTVEFATTVVVFGSERDLPSAGLKIAA